MKGLSKWLAGTTAVARAVQLLAAAIAGVAATLATDIAVEPHGGAQLDAPPSVSSSKS